MGICFNLGWVYGLLERLEILLSQDWELKSFHILFANIVEITYRTIKEHVFSLFPLDVRLWP